VWRFLRDEDGQGLAEYALAMALLSVAALIALTYVGDATKDLLSSANSTLVSATS
jgi:Flp pilus assembly pilin Flp